MVGEPNPVVTESNMSAAERAVSAKTPPASTPLPLQVPQTGAQPSSSQYKWLLVVSSTVPFIAVMLVIVYSVQYGEQSVSVATTGALVGLAVLVVAALVREIVQDDATIQSWLQRHALSVDDGSAS
ncbi:MAG: hypothetical protein LC799_22650 [Actinobacteria bacterium]|nr:hypothetical protein [Actinomycetota bacterium]